MYRIILALFTPNPQAKQKERSHGRLGKCKKQAKSKDVATLCFDNEKVYT